MNFERVCLETYLAVSKLEKLQRIRPRFYVVTICPTNAAQNDGWNAYFDLGKPLSESHTCDRAEFPLASMIQSINAVASENANPTWKGSKNIPTIYLSFWGSAAQLICFPFVFCLFCSIVLRGQPHRNAAAGSQNIHKHSAAIPVPARQRADSADGRPDGLLPAQHRWGSDPVQLQDWWVPHGCKCAFDAGLR